MEETIFTLNARDNILLDVFNSYKPDRTTIFETINEEFQNCLSYLSKKDIHYQDLKNCLIPSTNRNEIGLVFDRLRINSSSYGYEIFPKIIPLFDLQSCHSILHGDYIGDYKKEKLSSMFFKEINSNKSVIYNDNNQFYIIYINNLSDKMVHSINDGLTQFDPYVGFFNLTYSSLLKTYLSFILVNTFIKSKRTIISNQDDYSDSNEAENTFGQHFKQNRLIYKGVPSRHYDLFLSYKIERGVYEGFKSDTNFSINSLTTNVLDISDFTLIIGADKFQYLLKEKAGTLNQTGITNLNPADLEILIKEKINENYIYNLTFIKQHNTIKFNIILEFYKIDKKCKMKLLVALEYIPINKILRLITMY